jgi:hypothetical protein
MSHPIPSFEEFPKYVSIHNFRINLTIDRMRLLIAIGLISLTSCGGPAETVDHSCYIEARTSFHDPLNEDFTLTQWIRKPENIRTLHETFKKYGYSKIFSEYDLTSNPCMIWSYINKPCSTLIDSLILTYPRTDRSPKYYREFWQRRAAEQNDTTVYAVLKEVKSELMDKNNVAFNNKMANDTIYNLLRIKLKKPANEQEATGNFEYLTQVGLHLSAYNLLFEATWYGELEWDKEKLKGRLRTDTTSCSAWPIIVDDTK